jgi:hypothetical protein
MFDCTFSCTLNPKLYHQNHLVFRSPVTSTLTRCDFTLPLANVNVCKVSYFLMAMIRNMLPTNSVGQAKTDEGYVREKNHTDLRCQLTNDAAIFPLFNLGIFR